MEEYRQFDRLDDDTRRWIRRMNSSDMLSFLGFQKDANMEEIGKVINDEMIDVLFPNPDMMLIPIYSSMSFLLAHPSEHSIDDGIKALKELLDRSKTNACKGFIDWIDAVIGKEESKCKKIALNIAGLILRCMQEWDNYYLDVFADFHKKKFEEERIGLQREFGDSLQDYRREKYKLTDENQKLQDRNIELEKEIRRLKSSAWCVAVGEGLLEERNGLYVIRGKDGFPKIYKKWSDCLKESNKRNGETLSLPKHEEISDKLRKKDGSRYSEDYLRNKVSEVFTG